nr:alpha-galactosidase [uncultured Tolumonas sp.]
MNVQIVKLHSTNSTLILQTAPAVEILYWGEKLNAAFDVNVLSAIKRAVPHGRLDADVPMTLSPEHGRGLFSSPGLEGHRNGKDWSPVFHFKSLTEKQNALQLISEDTIAGLQLEIELRLDPQTDVLQVRHTLTNLKPENYQVDRFAITLLLPERADELLAFHGRWVREFQPHRLNLKHGGYHQENRRGRTSHENFPAFIQGTTGFKEQQGEVWGFHFGWSGNHRLRSDVKTDGRRFMQAEALYFAGEIQLAEHESLSTPWLYATYSKEGLNGMSHAFHQFVRQQILHFPTDKPRPVHLNTWEGIYFQHDPDYIMQMATQAAALGIERFIIDDGWFKGRDHDRAALGDWYLDEKKYPNGLEPVVTHVRNLGMEFGIWVEPEMINPDSDLYRAHPDWLLAEPEYNQPTGRNQYALDLQNPDVFAYLLARLDDLLSRYDISYIKWDMNREIVQPGHEGKAAITGQTHAVYRLFDELRSRHPLVEIESCASGGGRIDFEVLKRTHRFWTSDNNDALERQQIQRGMSYFFPPEVMGSHIGSAHCHCTARSHSIQFRGLTALFGHMGVELDPVKESAEEQAGFAHFIALHKQLRPLLHTGRVVRIDHHDSAMMINGVVAEDKTEAVFLLSQLAMPTYSLSGSLRLPELLADKNYRLTVLEKPARFDGGVMKIQPEWLTQEETVLSGEWLEKVGIALPVMDPESAVLFQLKML